VDEVACLVRVERTIIEVARAKSGNGTRFAIKDVPKSGKRREVAISQQLVDYLNQVADERGLASDDLYFAMPDRGATGGSGFEVPVVTSVRTASWPMGEPVSRSHFRDVWASALSKAGLPSLRFHDLRASHISWLLAAGTDVPTVMKRAGHTQITTTQRYTQSLSGSDHRAVEALERMVSATP
jgi:integrase